MRRALTAFLRFMLRLFFRRIEIVGREHIPADKPVMFAANHPNGLVDPLFFLCFAPRRVSVLAKAPLFRYPLIGYFVRALDSVPVYRKQDNTSGSNEETFARAREVLSSGGSIAIFPEGTTHSDPQLRELKTGAARIALGSQLPSVVIVPAGIYYTAKQTFRSEALVWFGEPIEAKGDVRELTDEIEKQLDAVTLQADSKAALELIARAEEIFSAGTQQPLAQELELRRRFADGYHFLRENDPEQLERLASEVRRFPMSSRTREDGDESGRQFATTLALLPLAIIGAITNFLPYRAVDFCAKRIARNQDEIAATIKFVASLVFYPLTWIALAALAWHFISDLAGILTLLFVPLLGYVALRVIERLDEFVGSLRASPARVVAQRQRIRDQILAVAEVMDRGARS